VSPSPRVYDYPAFEERKPLDQYLPYWKPREGSDMEKCYVLRYGASAPAAWRKHTARRSKWVNKL